MRKMIAVLLPIIGLFMLCSCGQEVTNSQPPAVVYINNGATITTSREVQLTFCPTIDAMEMAIYDDTQLDYQSSSWEKYSAYKTWTLLDDEGTQEVVVVFKDAGGNIYGPYSRSIIYERDPGEVKIIDKENVGANKYRITWINPAGGEYVVISAESASVIGVSPSRVNGSAFQLGSCEVTTNGDDFSLLFKCKDLSGNLSSGLIHDFHQNDDFIITRNTAPRPSAISGYRGLLRTWDIDDIKNNGSELAKSVKVTYGFYNPVKNTFKRAVVDCGDLLPGATGTIAVYIYSLDWQIYSKYAESE